MTLEEELALIRKNRAPSQALQEGLQGLSDLSRPTNPTADATEATPAPAPEAAAPKSPPRTPAEIDAELGLPPVETGLAPLPTEDAGFFDVMGAAWRKGTLNEMYTETMAERRRALTEEMYGQLPQAAKDRIEAVKKKLGRGLFAGWQNVERAVVGEANKVAAGSVDEAARWARYPLSEEAFGKRVLSDMQADDDEAEAILGEPGGGLAEFLGGAGRSMTTPENIALTFIGGGAGGLWRTVASEMLLNGAAEAISLPDEYTAAAALGNEDPNAVNRIATGAALGGVFGGAFYALGRGLTALQARAEARRASLAETVPPGVDRIDHEAELDAAEAQLRGDQTVQERLGYEGGARAEAPSKGTLGDVLDAGPRARVVMDNTGAGTVRNQPIDPVLETRLSDAVTAVYGPNYTVRVYSGGQPSADQAGARKGSVRHDHGRAADVHIFGPDGRQLTGDDLAPIAQYWAASRFGGVGLEMEGGGIHLDIHETPPAGGGMTWSYSPLTPAQQAAVDAGLRGEMPELRGTPSAAPSGAAPLLPPVGPGAPPGWEQIRNGIFAGESGADFNALFGYQNRKGGKFSHIKPSEMTVDQWLAFQDPNGEYAQWVKANRPDPENGVATPMGAYQIVGTTLRELKRDLGLKGDEVMTPEFQDYLAQEIYRRQGAGAWQGYKGPRDSYTAGTVDGPAPDMSATSRGYTGQGQVAVGEDTKIDVNYEVVDYRSLIRASGDLQPRDRTRINSDEWVASTAARLDPAQLMPAPTADRGTPIVGPDNVIESGNGRSMAIARAYERHPDRAEAYRGAIEAAGFTIPDGVEQPVLIARRRTDLTPDQRRQMVIDAQDSGVAQMTPTEVARATARNLQSSILSRLDPSQPLAADANGDFVRSALATLPRSARNAMFDPGGALNALGQRQLREAIFARAWPDPDILARYTEGAPAELKSLMEALETAASSWAALKADIEAGLVTPDMDIGAYVLDAMRLIGAARELAQKQGMPIAKAVAELLDEIDLIEGPISPLTAALVRKMWKGGRAAPADEVASFLTRYADEARKAGQSGGMFDAPSPRDVLRTIDPETFKDLPEDMGQARGFATRPTSEAPAATVRELPDQGFDHGARSPEAEAVHAEIEAELRGDEGPFGPVYKGYADKPEDAVAKLLEERTGEVPDAITIEGLGPVRFVWGSRTLGLRHILEKHGEAVVRDLPRAMREGKLGPEYNGRRDLITEDTPQRKTVVRLDWDGDGKPWVVTSHDVIQGTDAQPGRTSNVLPETAPPSVPGATARSEDSAAAAGAQAADPIASELAAARADLGEFADIEIDLPDGTTARAGDILDDLDMDRAADAVIQACATSSNGAAQ